MISPLRHLKPSSTSKKRAESGIWRAELLLNDLSVETLEALFHIEEARSGVVAGGIGIGALVVDDVLVPVHTALVAEVALFVVQNHITARSIHKATVLTLHEGRSGHRIGRETVHAHDEIARGLVRLGLIAVLRDTLQPVETAPMNHFEAVAVIASLDRSLQTQIALTHIRRNREDSVGAGSIPLLTALVREHTIDVEAANSIERTGIVAIRSRRAIGSNDAHSVVATNSWSHRERIGESTIDTLHVVICERIIHNLSIIGHTLSSQERASGRRAHRRVNHGSIQTSRIGINPNRDRDNATITSNVIIRTGSRNHLSQTVGATHPSEGALGRSTVRAIGILDLLSSIALVPFWYRNRQRPHGSVQNRYVVRTALRFVLS